MPTFEPPVVNENPTVLPDTKGVAYNLFRHYGPRPVGQTVIIFNDGSCTTVQYPYVTETEFAGYSYDDIHNIYLGGRTYEVTEEEAVLLTACGLGSGLQ